MLVQLKLIDLLYAGVIIIAINVMFLIEHILIYLLVQVLLLVQLKLIDRVSVGDIMFYDNYLFLLVIIRHCLLVMLFDVQ